MLVFSVTLTKMTGESKHKHVYNVHRLYWIPFHRWNVSLEHEARSLDTITKCLSQPITSRKQRLGCVHPPLLNIDVPNIVIDELHLMLRVTDVLIRNMIWAMIHNDLREVQQRRQPQHLDKLVQRIRSCGITFSVSYIQAQCNILIYAHDNFSHRFGKTRPVAIRLMRFPGHP